MHSPNAGLITVYVKPSWFDPLDDLVYFSAGCSESQSSLCCESHDFIGEAGMEEW